MRKFFVGQSRRGVRIWLNSDGYLSSATDGEYKDPALDILGELEDELIIDVSEPFVLEMTEVGIENADVFIAAEAAPAITEEMIEELVEQSAQRVTEVNKTTRKHIQRAITKAQERGYSVRETAYGSKRTRKDKFKPLDDVIKELYHGRPECIARTELAIANNNAQIRRFASMGMNTVDVFDGPGCGWTTHDDPDKANGTTRSVEDSLRMPISHPNCVRSFLPSID